MHWDELSIGRDQSRRTDTHTTKTTPLRTPLAVDMVSLLVGSPHSGGGAQVAGKMDAAMSCGCGCCAAIGIKPS